MRGTLEVALYAYLHPSYQHCTDDAQKAETVLSAVSYTYIYIYIFFLNLLFLYDFLYFFLQHLCRSLKIWKVVKFHFHIVLKIVYMTWKIK